MNRNLASRLEKLEGTRKDSGRVIVIECDERGTQDGAKAFFEETTGSVVEQKDFIMLERRSQKGTDAAAEASSQIYAVVGIFDGAEFWAEIFRMIDGKSRGLPKPRETRVSVWEAHNAQIN
ncbi:hypothetical protein GCM10007874_11280 [Labrys miyagiensis]|uniref:Uncharacterized protein n=1 Tax=Labrys miyagiensis TaxID=346912 RepID=A0ABQ6CEM1_9HYPH|nr:hypothetical protein [Labrys miyagiensis]GLS18112.1 hypothetical protein GCM10007874_11280 [Labrys miyagiensis]